MLSLRESLQKVEPAGAINSIRNLDNLMQHGSNVGQAVSFNQVAKSVSSKKKITITSLTFMWQNIALFPHVVKKVGIPVSPILYKGRERENVIASLMKYIRNEVPDVIGLCEVWVGDEAIAIKNSISDIYPHAIYGPNETAKDDIETEEFSGGLLLLSRHPIVSHGHTIYRQCCGEDCLTNKGILHARIAVPNHPTQYDVFVTHMQSCPPQVDEIPGVGSGSCDDRLEIHQVNHLSSFIQSCSSPERISLLMGDLNINGKDQDKLTALSNRLRQPLDLWQASGNGTIGITSDSHGSFQKDRADRASNDPKRNQEGSRLDYLFSFHAHKHITPFYGVTKVINDLQTNPGRDLSDHYGLKGQLKSIAESKIEAQGINKVFVTMRSFHCLRETGGAISPGSDSMIFRIWGMSENGQEQSVRVDQEDQEDLDNIDTGDTFDFLAGKTISLSDPGNWIAIKFQAWEDDFVSEFDLGHKTIHISRNTLLYYKKLGHSVQLASPVLQGDLAEYVVFVYLDVN